MTCKVFVAIVGVGGVGKHVVEQIRTLSRSHSYIKLVLLSRSRCSHYVPEASLEEQTLESDNWEASLQGSKQPCLSPSEVVSYLKRCPGRSILIDNTSGSEISKIYQQALKEGISIATPNKKAFSGSLSQWNEIFGVSNSPSLPNNGHVQFESTVGAGLPILSTLSDLLVTGDKIRRIEGVFSGTLSYLFNNFAPTHGPGGKWSHAVADAKAAGFTEPDPRDDLNGLDVARKVVILARAAGLQVDDTAAFPVQSLIPRALESCKSGDEFLAKLPEHDSEMDEIKIAAARDDKIIRFVGSIDLTEKKLTVGLQKFAKDHPFANLKGSDNIISFLTERYPINPLVIQGAGAGGAVTAMGVVSDVAKIAQLLQ